MITMIIVEDESFERKSLINCIDWNLIGVEVIGDASNGETGIALVKEKQPDIVLTDINMPVMNAIEMSREIRRINPDIKIIFISSYNDFEYAKQAIELKIFSYIMKPINESELLRTVKRAVDSITEKRLEDKIYNNMKNNYKKDMLLIREALLLRILMGSQVEDKELEKANLNWLFYENDNVKCIFSIAYESDGNQSISGRVKEISELCEKQSEGVISACYNKGKIITIVSVREENMENTLNRIENDIIRYMEGQGFRKITVKKEYSAGKEKNIAGLYNDICKKTMQYQEERTSFKNKNKSKQFIVDEIDHIILTHFREDLSIEEIAKAMHFTPNYIGMVYKNVKKESITQSLNKVRMKEAEKLLKETKLTVHEISYMCGFENVTYFHTLFKKEKGMTPSEYRNL